MTLAHIASFSAKRISAENFPVALRILPARPRTQLIRGYGYARFVDDVGDEAPGDRLALLDLIEADVLALAAGSAQLAPVIGVGPVLTDCSVPIETLLDLIQANRVDQYTRSYETFDDLLGYCALSAAPIGRMVLHIAGAADERNIADSDRVCAALQVLEHCQDVGADARAGRVYLPAADLRAAGVRDADLLDGRTSAALRRVLATQAERSADLLDSGRHLVHRLSGWPRLAVAGYVAGGLATVHALRSADYDVLAGHVAPAKTRTAVRAARLIVGR